MKTKVLLCSLFVLVSVLAVGMPSTQAAGDIVILDVRGGIDQNDGQAPVFTITRPHKITQITNYHFNFNKGAKGVGTISLRDATGKPYGTWQAYGVYDSGNPNNGVPAGKPILYWMAYPDTTLPAGTYYVADSEPSTWASSSGKGQYSSNQPGKGHTIVRGIPM